MEKGKETSTSNASKPRQQDPAAEEDNRVHGEEAQDVSGGKSHMSSEDAERARRSTRERNGEEE